MRKPKKQKAFGNIQLLIDEKGKEYLSYMSAVGIIKDYSPWTIKEFKEYKEMKG